MSDRRKPFAPNPVLAGLFGLAPLAAAANDLPKGIALGLGAALAAILLGALLPTIRLQIPERFRAHVSLALSTAFALMYGLALEAWFPLVSASLWLYVPLVAVGCLSLHAIRSSSSPARGEGPSRFGLIDKGAAGYFLVSVLLGAFREAAGEGALTIPTPDAEGLQVVLAASPPCRLLSSPAGGFMLLGFTVAAYRGILRLRGRRIP